ncbi:MAG: RsmB/NOP family class I SAM-dependent RNA methyltransferase [candidate division Zixibacteria bacterium]|nr:RsmB/NOP family class I SAM-dependent RNA methyltransferase [candidate division Zixibacteria bacterium]
MNSRESKCARESKFDSIVIPESFRLRYEPLVDNPSAFFETIRKPLKRSFRVNTLKSTCDEIENRFDTYGIEIKQTKWLPLAYVSENPDIGSTLESFLGKIYIQELTSMLPPLVVEEEIRNARSILDSCAAPGSKTTQIAALTSHGGTLLASDINYSRIRALKNNINKVGATNCVIANQDLREFPKVEFDIVFFDAPCSSDGTLRKSPNILPSWTEKKINRFTNLQKIMILKAFDLVRRGGTLVYSTCAFSPEENEEVVDYLLRKRDASIAPITLPGITLGDGLTNWAGAEFDSQLSKTRRVWPHHNDTGGFYIAKILK